uniref:Uncharacterized protein n=1 Tax=viral metagenome TaxID=1070528 RepID=A0A6C0BN70_9ZZZZ
MIPQTFSVANNGKPWHRETFLGKGAFSKVYCCTQR